MLETHITMARLLSAVNYQEYKWLIFGDLHIAGLVLALQGGHTKYPCRVGLTTNIKSDKTVRSDMG